MNQFMNDLHDTIAYKQDDMTGLKKLFEKYYPVLKSASIETTNNDNQTYLLKEIETLNQHANHSAYYNALILMLSSQADDVPESCIISFVKESIAFFKKMNSQTKLFSFQHEVSKVASTLTTYSCEIGYARQIIQPLINACNSVSASSKCLNAIHGEILKACVSAKMFLFGIQFMDNFHILEINPRFTYLKPIHFTQYFLMGGMCYIHLNQMDKALECLHHVIHVPAHNNVVPPVTIVAYQKAQLVSLVLNNQPYKLKKSVSSSVQQCISEKPPEPYYSIVKAYENNNLSALLSIIQNAKDRLQSDDNMYLALACVKSFYQYRIVKISKVYDCITLDEIMRNVFQGHPQLTVEDAKTSSDDTTSSSHPNQSIVSAQQVVELLSELNENNKINIKIDQVAEIPASSSLLYRSHPPVVWFYDTCVKLQSSINRDNNEGFLINQLEQQLVEVVQVQNVLRQMHQEMLTSSSVVSYVLNNNSSK